MLSKLFCAVAHSVNNTDLALKIPSYTPESLNYDKTDKNSFSLWKFMRQFDLIAVSLADWRERKEKIANSKGISITTTVTLSLLCQKTKDLRQPQNK
jgi:hypothetical protein